MILTGMWLSAVWVVLGHCFKICGDGGIQNKDVEALWEFLRTISSRLLVSPPLGKVFCI